MKDLELYLERENTNMIGPLPIYGIRSYPTWQVSLAPFMWSPLKNGDKLVVLDRNWPIASFEQGTLTWT